jgi:hypothetical protein
MTELRMGLDRHASAKAREAWRGGRAQARKVSLGELPDGDQPVAQRRDRRDDLRGAAWVE